MIRVVSCDERLNDLWFTKCQDLFSVMRYCLDLFSSLMLRDMPVKNGKKVLQSLLLNFVFDIKVHMGTSVISAWFSWGKDFVVCIFNSTRVWVSDT